MTESGCCLRVHASSIRRYSVRSGRLNQYLDGKRWKCQKLRRIWILRSVIPQSGVECVLICSIFYFDCRGSKNRSTEVDLSKYFTAHEQSRWKRLSMDNDHHLFQHKKRRLIFRGHMSIDPEANVQLRDS